MTQTALKSAFNTIWKKPVVALHFLLFSWLKTKHEKISIYKNIILIQSNISHTPQNAAQILSSLILLGLSFKTL